MYVEAIKVICLYVISGHGITIIKKEIKMLLMNIAPRVADKRLDADKENDCAGSYAY